MSEGVSELNANDGNYIPGIRTGGGEGIGGPYPLLSSVGARYLPTEIPYQVSNPRYHGVSRERYTHFHPDTYAVLVVVRGFQNNHGNQKPGIGRGGGTYDGNMTHGIGRGGLPVNLRPTYRISQADPHDGYAISGIGREGFSFYLYILYRVSEVNSTNGDTKPGVEPTASKRI